MAGRKPKIPIGTGRQFAVQTVAGFIAPYRHERESIPMRRL
jgi:hypothetical protein